MGEKVGYQKKRLADIEHEIHQALEDLQEQFNISLDETDYWFEILSKDKYVKFITDYILKKGNIENISKNEIQKVIYDHTIQEVGLKSNLQKKSQGDENDKPSDTE